MEKHLVITSKDRYFLEDNPGRVLVELAEGDGYALIKGASSVDDSSVAGLYERFVGSDTKKKGEDAILDQDPCIPTILRSTTLNPVTKMAIYGGKKVLLVPRRPAVHCCNPSSKDLNGKHLFLVKEATQYTTGDQSVLLMKMQFLRKGDRFQIFVIKGSHKNSFESGSVDTVDLVDVEGGDELLFHAALLLSYPRYTGPNERSLSLHTMYLVGGDVSGELPDLPHQHWKRIVEVGGSEVKKVTIQLKLNCEWV